MNAVHHLAKPAGSATPSNGGSPFFQPKLTINSPGDQYEKEADAVADKIMRRESPFIQAKPIPVSTVQRKCADCKEEEEKKIQRKEMNAGEVTTGTILENYVGNLSGGGEPLSAEVRNFYEPRFGCDFGNVKVHTNSQAVESAQSINALAYTTGSNIVFNSGQYSPQSEAGKRLLGHELTHVVQQGGSLKTKRIQRAENDTSVGCAPLVDSKTDVNSYVNAALTALRPATAPALISGLRGGIGSDMVTSPGRTQIEGWASGLPSTKQHQPSAASTKYSGVTFRLWSNPFFPILNPTMKVNGICIGSDKLGHFFQQGHEYYEESHRTGGSVASAIAGGQAQESGGYGLRSTGVYSNADLEANKKGLDFYNALAASPAMSFDIATYINSNWSELNNPNYYESSTGTTVWGNLLAGSWNGTFGETATGVTRRISANLRIGGATTTVTGTFAYGAVTGTLTGRITLNTLAPPGSPSGTSAISGVTINYDWISGLNTGKGVWNNVRENELHGTWGNGASNSNGGYWNMSK